MWTLDHAVFASFLATAVAAVLFGYLYLIQRERYVGYFSLFWLLYSLKMVGDISVVSLPGMAPWTLLNQVLVAGMGLSLLKAVHCFSGKRLSSWWLWATLGFLTYATVSQVHELQAWPYRIPLFLYHASLFVTSLYLFSKTNDFTGNVRPFTLGLLIVWGAIQVAYPFVHDIPGIALYGYFVSALVKLALAMAMLSGYVRHTKDGLNRGQDTIQRAIDLVPFLVYAKTRSGRFIMANQAVADLYGVDRATLLARHPGDFPNNGPTLHQLCEADEQVMNRQVASQAQQETIVGNKGWRRVMQTTRIPYQVPGIAEKSILVVSADVTDQNQDQTDQSRLDEQFRQAQKMESIGRMAGGVAQDFNDLLTGIIGNLDLALMDLNEHDPLRETLTHLKQAATRTGELTHQLLTFGRRQQMDASILNPNECIEDLMSMLTRLLGAEIRLRLRLSPDVGYIRANTEQLEQILVNLAQNAKEAMPHGGELAVETSDIVFDAQFCQSHPEVEPGKYVKLAISDTGVGMDDATRKQMFEPFFTTKPRGTASGLGLSTVYGIVKQHHGTLDVYSKPDWGTALHIYFPRAHPVQDAQQRLSRSTPVSIMPSGTETVLFVEDEQIIRELAVKVLRRLGYTVLDAADVGEAFLRCEESRGPIHLLVTDMDGDTMDGRELSDSLAVNHPEMRVLFTSQYTEQYNIRNNDLDPNSDFLRKPFSPQLLAAKVREVLDRRRSAQTPIPGVIKNAQTH